MRRHRDVARAVDSVVASGGTAAVTISATNVGSTVIAISESCQGEFRTLDKQGTVVAFQQFCDQFLGLRFRELAPGEQVSFVQTWKALKPKATQQWHTIEGTSSLHRFSLSFFILISITQA